MKSTFVLYISITTDLISKFRDDVCIAINVNVSYNTKSNLTVISLYFPPILIIIISIENKNINKLFYFEKITGKYSYFGPIIRHIRNISYYIQLGRKSRVRLTCTRDHHIH